MKDTVFVRDLTAQAIIGINDWERGRPQDILINIVVFADGSAVIFQIGTIDQCIPSLVGVKGSWLVSSFCCHVEFRLKGQLVVTSNTNNLFKISRLFTKVLAEVLDGADFS